MEVEREASGHPKDRQVSREPDQCHAGASSLWGTATPEMLGLDFPLRVREQRRGRASQPGSMSVWVLNGSKGNGFDRCLETKRDSQGLQSIARSAAGLSSSPGQ